MTKGTVLVVEDTPLNMKLVRTLLKVGGFAVLESTEAEKGIQLAREHHPDLVLMDLQMPVMDGYAAAVAIRELPGICAEVPIVALTANVMAESDAGERGVQLDGYLSKPLSRRVLLETVVSWMERSSTPSEIAGTAKAGSNEAKL